VKSSLASPKNFALSVALSLVSSCPAEELHGDYLMSDADLTFYGAEFNGWAGFSVTSAGDFNGDGYDDMVVGTPFTYYANPGKTYLVYGGPDDDPASRTLSPTNVDVTFVGESRDSAGFTTSSAGDINRDGLDDLLIATWPGRFSQLAGPAEVHLVYGRPDSQRLTGQFSLANADASFVLNQPYNVPNPYLRWGFELSLGGDIDGDGALDLLIGAYWADPDGRVNAGETYLFYGDRTAPFTGEYNLEAADAIFTGDEAGSGTGWAVSADGDFNGDGRDDIVVTTPIYQETYVVYGRASEQRIMGRIGPSDADATFVGVSPPNQYAGSSVSTSGDVNGDGVDDLLIGASHAEPGKEDLSSSAYLLFGKTGGNAWSGVTSLSDADVTFSGIAASYESTEGLSIRVSTAGDINGDGVDDVLIGAHEAPGDPSSYLAGAQGGKAFLVYGRRDGWLDQSNFDLAEADATFAGKYRNFIGWSMDTAGDFNGDGFDDIILGSPEYGDRREGAAYIFYGRPVPEPCIPALIGVCLLAVVSVARHRHR